MLFAGDDESPPLESPDPLVVSFPLSDPRPGTDLEPCDGAAPTSDPSWHFSNFSLREYVFRSRSKDISANWPFSQKNLQICLQHGVTEVLPPFKCIDAVNCHSFEISKFENRSFVGKDCFSGFQSVPSSSKSKVPSPECTAVLNVDGAAASSEQLSMLQSPTKGNTPLVAVQVSQPSTVLLPRKTVIPPASFESESLAQEAGKKCRLIVKFGAKSERSSGDDAASNCTSVPENMGSKVCPVCKTFSSSSNTTLNAHIDQCLSLESMPKGLAIRHRIKPRKTRLMVDIYETAKRCTVEELNRRNGLACTNSLIMDAPTVDAVPGEKGWPGRQMVRAGDPNDDGAVYIDANGTKLRILSKFSDASTESGSIKHVRSKKSSQQKKGIGMFKKKMKKLHGQKIYKSSKLASKNKKLHSMKRHDSQLLERKNVCWMDEEGEGSQGHSQWSQGPVKPGVCGILRRWSSSKRTSVKKKLVAKERENPQRCQLRLAHDSLDDSDQTSLVSRMPMTSCSFSLLDTSENSVYSRNSDSEKEKSWPECLSFETEPAECKRSIAWSDVTTDSIEKWSSRKLQKDDHLQEVNRANIRKPSGHDELLVRPKKGVDSHVIIDVSNGRQLRPKSFSRKAWRFSTLRKRVLSRCQSSENSSDVSVGQREFSFKKPKRHSPDRASHVLEDPFNGRFVREDIDFEVSPGESCERERTGLPEVVESSGISEKVHHANFVLKDTLDAEPSGDAVDDCTWGLGEYYDLARLNHSDGSWTDSRSRQFLGISNETLCSIEDDFSRVYNVGDVGNEGTANGRNDESYGAGLSSSFIEIDPIPIPGPPGSYLPSPGATGSDDFQGNSSLTTSQAQSSHHHQGLIDGDASDSPASATSTVSNSAEAKWGRDYSEDLVSVGRPPLPNTWMSFSNAGNDCYSNQQSTSTAPATIALPETISGNSDGKNANNGFVNKGPPFTIGGGWPCCCQKKDRAVSQSSILDYREMQPPSLGRQMGQDPVSMIGSKGLIPEAAKTSIAPSSRGFASGELSNGSDHVDCDFPSPSGNNPVLRLMGKDLIVINKEDDAPTMLNQSQSGAPAPVPAKIRDSICGIPRVGGQNKKEYRHKDTDYTPVHSFDSSSIYPGITLPVTVQHPRPVPKLAGASVGSRLLSQFESMTVEQVGPSKQIMTTAAAPIYPQEVMVIDDVHWRNSGAASTTIPTGNLPKDAVLLPQAPANTARETTAALPAIYHPREPFIPCKPVSGLAGSLPKQCRF
ncbi:hypothetical protein MLD38_034306 [Melastoma candidum]|uniref:Uncharacterized protein n=1 Tax=Melastoma candidum TaxID=119954 RepID=A0ACB9MBM5_9MYRT|nr:hypothetical protein MLD38_034306 [Melastoma candidum]